MPTSVKQHSFAGGMITDQVLGRTNQAKYQTGLRLLSNAYVQRHGLVANRPGTLFDQALPFIHNGTPWSNAITYTPGFVVTVSGTDYVCLVQNQNYSPPSSPTQWAAVVTTPATTPIWRPFRMVVDYGDSFELLFTSNLVRICQAGQPITVALSSMAAWSSVVAYAIGNIVSSGGSAWICQTAHTNQAPAAGVYWRAMQVSSGSNYILDIPLNSWPSTPGNYGVQCPIAALASMQVVNFNNVVTCASTLFPPFQIRRTSNAAWAVTLVVAAQPLPAPTGVSVSTNHTGTAVYNYAVTAIIGSGTESPVSATASVSCNGFPTSGMVNTVQWTAVPGATGYNIYQVNVPASGASTYFLLATVSGNGVIQYGDTTGAAQASSQPAQLLFNSDPVTQAVSPLFFKPADWPGVVFYYQQRLGFAASINNPTTIWLSRILYFLDFSVATPVTDSSAIQAVIAAETAQPIIACVDIGQQMVVHTADGEYAVGGNSYGSVTPSAFIVKRQGSRGCKLPRPVVIGSTDIFLQARGTFLQDLRYDIYRQQYNGKDLTVFASGIFNGRTIVDMCYQCTPDSIIWLVLSDGTLASMTYIGGKDAGDDGVWAWAEHSLGSVTIPGFVTGQPVLAQYCTCVPNGTADTVYITAYGMVGSTNQTVLLELAAREFTDTAFLSDWIGGADQCIPFNAWAGAIVNAVVTTTTGGYTPSDVIQVVASMSWTGGDAGTMIALQPTNPLTGALAGGAYAWLTVRTVVNSTTVLCTVGATLPSWAYAAGASPAVARAFSQVTGLTALAGMQVAVCGDGNVLSSPLNPAMPTLVVSAGGVLTLPVPALRGFVGIPYQTDIETLPIESEQQTISDCLVVVRKATPIFYRSCAAWIGQDSTSLTQWLALRNGGATPIWGMPVEPFTGPASMAVTGTAQTTGQVWIRAVDPLPLALSALTLRVEVADG